MTPIAATRIPTEGFAFGADYNPEQWDAATIDEDLRLMQEAQVNLVTLGVFAWGALEIEDGQYDFDWLLRIMDRLDGAGIGVDLATPTASPPHWLFHAHPEIAFVDEQGTRAAPGSRQAWCPSSPIIAERVERLDRALAERVRDHPALRMWHVGNELGCHNARCHCDVSAAAFREWLKARYRSVEALNEAWGTAFWGLYYRDFAHVLPPRRSVGPLNPALRLDFARFSSDQQLERFRAERDVLRAITPDIPITTNLMVTEVFRDVDYSRLTPELDLVSNDHYTIAADPEPWYELAFSADRTRGLAGGESWLLMEHSTSQVNWQPRNVAKGEGELMRNSFSHLARGADGIMFFQWRQSRSGSEKFHSAMVPNAGLHTRIWEDVRHLGASLTRLREIRGTSTPRAPIALLFDYESWWSSEVEAHPTVDFSYTRLPRAIHRALTRGHYEVDVLPATAPLDGYAAIVLPSLYLMTAETADAVAAAAARGAHVLVGYCTAVVDEHDRLWPGGMQHRLRELLGVGVDEIAPLREGASVGLDDGSVGTVWAEMLAVDDAEVLARYAEGPLGGLAAVTRRRHPARGAAWHLSTQLDDDGLARLVERFCRHAGISPTADADPDVELRRRVGEDGSYLFAINHGAHPGRVEARGYDLLGDRVWGAGTRVPARGVSVIREEGKA